MPLKIVERLSLLLGLTACSFDATGIESSPGPSTTAGPTSSDPTTTTTPTATSNPEPPTTSSPTTTSEPATDSDVDTATTTPVATTSTTDDSTSTSTDTTTTGEPETGSSSSSSSGPGPQCGDGVVNDGEPCDDGNADNNDACLIGCKPATCGDGFIQTNVEMCDDGNGDETDACTTSCLQPTCSDNAKNGDELGIDCGGPCPACPIASCLELKTVQPAAKSGLYEIDPDKGGPIAPFQVYCEQSFDGGGWTMVLKVDGRLPTFIYTSALWTDANPYMPDPALNRKETKLRSWDTLPVQELLVAMEAPIKGGGPLDLHYLKVPDMSATSMHALFSAGTYKPSMLGRAAWKALVPGSSLQPYCEREGVNVTPPGGQMNFAQVRIGILGNENMMNDCTSPNSFIGVGGVLTASCIEVGTATTGNRAGCMSDNGDKDLPGFAIVFLR